MMNSTNNNKVAHQAGQTHYNYELQCWVTDGICQRCAHPDSMREEGACCNQWRLAGIPEVEAMEKVPNKIVIPVSSSNAFIKAVGSRHYQPKQDDLNPNILVAVLRADNKIDYVSPNSLVAEIARLEKEVIRQWELGDKARSEVIRLKARLTN